MAEVPTDEPPWLSLTEAAELTGLDREALRSRVRRGLIPSRKNNHGMLVVQVSAEALTDHDPALRSSDRDATADLARMQGTLADLQAEVAELRVSLARSEADRDAAKAVAAAELAAKDALVAELRAMLTDARRPFWRRWSG